ncbi:AAA family ATPase [Clostridium tarantellae]|uniref:AAA domain-containing protein n=1 Tax=Clostridium tarantellae TaxID=39493 RepID=A0A6I1MK92_9CLOT|nr:AAA family ATPase [Clostridium tarantellae]MPQ43440.1 AAA domain-containing protein [Clostridium tarantellae]
MEVTKIVSEILMNSYKMAKTNNDEYITPEHFLYNALKCEEFKEIIEVHKGNVKEIKTKLKNYIDEFVNKIKSGEPKESIEARNMLFIAAEQAAYSGRQCVGLEHLVSALFNLENSYAVYYLEEQGISKRELLFDICHNNNNKFSEELDSDKEEKINNKENKSIIEKYAVNLNSLIKEGNKDPLIGRKDIIERTMQILSRRTKNNPIHVGEPGVGKTAITLGLASLIVEGKVPKALKNAEIFSLDIGSIIAGTKYRGDFEERIHDLLDEIKNHVNPIVYIDEIHNIVGAGALSGGALDGAGLLKKYLLEGKIKFIGATTFDEYKKYFEKDKALSRRFQIIEVNETTNEETIKILEGLKKSFEDYHNVKYTNKALINAVKLSQKYINDKFLPDKAIDIIDEAGAYVSMNRKNNKIKRVDEKIIEEIISKMCNIPKQTVESSEINSLKILDEELKKNIFGQDNAIEEVVRCIKMSRAGLNEDNKPVASMLFVGPTGVGKTEIARTLSKVLGVDLIRFDMSEYGEKHSASKLIGSPPGYVGYEEGGLLTDIIRKKPNCVLLLDEIEKAHSDILNVLLQVMDYATLTDNKGRKADFRNAIIIMTSNAGAKNIGKQLVGFGEREISGESIKDEVKKIFAPEFRNRLDKIIVFNNIDKLMALNITNKELNNFKEKLKEKSVEINYSNECIQYISQKGISREFGARQIQRVINEKIKPLLIDEILFGKLSIGGTCTIDILENNIILKIHK